MAEKYKFPSKKSLIAISAGQYALKKGSDPVREHIRYLNYGLLGLVTMLHDKLGVDLIMASGEGCTPNELISRLLREGVLSEECECVLLSIPSYYSVGWSAELCGLLREKYGVRIIVGGRWVVDGNGEWIREKLGEVEIVEGFGERKLAEIFRPDMVETIADGATSCFSHLNYELLLDYKLYQPSIEISRGCGSGCKFCADRHNTRLENTPIASVISELEYLDGIYGDCSVYLEAPHFHFDRAWCNKFAEATEARGRVTPWRCTTRVESFPLDMIETLARSGLKIVDIGLESASHAQLIRMNKTKSPERYLERAYEILRECDRCGVWVKLNILIYAGETEETLAETRAWLLKNKSLIKGISVSTLVYYKGAGEIDELIECGARVPLGASLDESGYIELDPSEEISAARAREYGLQLSREIMSAEDFYDIKSVSYFERGYSFETFVRDAEKCDPSRLPFTL